MAGKLVPAGLNYLATNVVEKDNILGATKSKKAYWAKGLAFYKDSPLFFFAGCGYQFNRDLESIMNLLRRIDKSFIDTEWTMELAGLSRKLGVDVTAIYRRLFVRGQDSGRPLVAAVRVLEKLGLHLAYMGEDEPCCGGTLYFSGMHHQFKEHIARVNTRFKEAGVKQLISMVPSCTYTLKHLLPTVTGDSSIEVRHFCEVLAEKIPRLELVYPEEKKVTYHDSCQLVRYLDLVDEPRIILKSIKGIDFVEPKWTTGVWATCCGGGGGFEVIFPELSLTLAKNRVRELLETEAEIIVTHCPGCIMQLEAGLKMLNADHVRVMDLSQIVAVAMGV